jgi:predicted nucleic acid-binding protein
MRAFEADLVAPHVIDVEVVSGLRQLLASAEVTRCQAESGLTDYRDLDVTRYPVTLLLDRIWQLRGAHAYDAAYVALGEALGSPLVTTDSRLGRAHGHRAAIVAFPGESAVILSPCPSTSA